MKYAVCRLIWESRGYSYKTVSAALQKKLPGREGLASSTLQRHVRLGNDAPPDVVEAIRSLSLEPDCAPEGAEVVRLGLEALEQGPIVDTDALAASLRAKLPMIDPEVISAAITARLTASGELAKSVAAEVMTRQPDPFETAWKAAAEALAQEPKPPSTDEVVGKLVAALDQQAKPARGGETKIARYIARYLGRLTSPRLDAANAKVATTHAKVDGIDAKVDGVQSTLHQTQAKVDAFAARLDRNRRALWVVGGLVMLAIAPSSLASILRWTPSAALTSSAPGPGGGAVEEAARQRSRAFAEDHHLGALASGSAELGEKAPPERWIPKQPLPYQKLVPNCDAGIGEESINGGCWVGVHNMKPPCGRLFREGDICYRPVAVDPQRPVGGTP